MDDDEEEEDEDEYDDDDEDYDLIEDEDEDEDEEDEEGEEDEGPEEEEEEEHDEEVVADEADSHKHPLASSKTDQQQPDRSEEKEEVQQDKAEEVSSEVPSQPPILDSVSALSASSSSSSSSASSSTVSSASTSSSSSTSSLSSSSVLSSSASSSSSSVLCSSSASCSSSVGSANLSSSSELILSSSSSSFPSSSSSSSSTRQTLTSLILYQRFVSSSQLLSFGSLFSDLIRFSALRSLDLSGYPINSRSFPPDCLFPSVVSLRIMRCRLPADATAAVSALIHAFPALSHLSTDCILLLCSPTLYYPRLTSFVFLATDVDLRQFPFANLVVCAPALTSLYLPCIHAPIAILQHLACIFDIIQCPGLQHFGVIDALLLPALAHAFPNLRSVVMSLPSPLSFPYKTSFPSLHTVYLVQSVPLSAAKRAALFPLSIRVCHGYGEFDSAGALGAWTAPFSSPLSNTLISSHAKLVSSLFHFPSPAEFPGNDYVANQMDDDGEDESEEEEEEEEGDDEEGEGEEEYQPDEEEGAHHHGFPPMPAGCTLM